MSDKFSQTDRNHDVPTLEQIERLKSLQGGALGFLLWRCFPLLLESAFVNDSDFDFSEPGIVRLATTQSCLEDSSAPPINDLKAILKNEGEWDWRGRGNVRRTERQRALEGHLLFIFSWVDAMPQKQKAKKKATILNPFVV